MKASELICIDKTTDFNELRMAARQCAKGVKWKQTTLDFLNNINYKCCKIADYIGKNGYRPNRYNTFSITEPKPRKINSAPLSDRVIQRVMCNDTVYHDLTYFLNVNNVACQVDRGTLYASKRLLRHLYDYSRMYGNKGYVLRIDVRKFFDNIAHGEIKSIIHKRVSNPKYQEYLYALIDSFKISRIMEPHRCENAGIPLGSQLSQLFALTALHPIDDYIQRELKFEFYVRYMDDLLIICNDLHYLRIVQRLIIGRMECLGYETNYKTHISKLTDGVTFLHTRYFLTKTGRIIRRLEHSKFSAERRKLKRMFQNLVYKSHKNISLGIILRHYQGWRSGVIQKVGELAVYDMDNLFRMYLQSRPPSFIIGPTELEGLSKDFIRKFCACSMKTPDSNNLIQSYTNKIQLVKR